MMSLFTSKLPVKIDVTFVEDKDSGKVTYLDLEEGQELPPNTKKESFFFRKPDWAEMRDLMSMSSSLSTLGGDIKVDPWKYMDLKMKRLMVEWTLKSDDGKAIVLKSATIDALDPILIQFLNVKLEKILAEGNEIK